jgi:hypothetical protein
VADCEGSLILTFSDGKRAVATLPGTVMYTLGHYLRRLNMFEDLLILKAQRISRPLPLFVRTNDYIPKEYEYDPEDKYAAAQRGDASVGVTQEESDGDLATISSSGNDGDEEEGGVPSDHSDVEGGVNGTPTTKETAEEKEKRIEQERILHAAIKQRKILRLVSQYPVQLSTPFVDEFYQRITNEDSPYDVFDSGLIIVYRLWANTGSHQMFLIRGIREFIKARQRLGVLWNVDSLETFLVCTLYTEYDLIQSDLMIEPADYVDIEKRMMKRLRADLGKTSARPPPTSPPTSGTEDGGEGVAPHPYAPSGVGPDGFLRPEHEYDIPDEVFYMQKREELEIHRMAQYYSQRTTILETLYGGPSDFDRLSNPFYQRLSDMQAQNSHDKTIDRLLPSYSRTSSGAVAGARRMAPYSRSSIRSKDEGVGNERDPGRVRQEQDLLQSVLESLAAATDTTRDNWSEYMECTRKILIEVRDVVRQVKGNMAEAEEMAKKMAGDPSFTIPVEKSPPAASKTPASDTNPDKDVEAGGSGPAKFEDVPLTGAGEHSVRMDVLNSKIVWGHGIPIVDEDGLPIGPYSPDKPHLPIPTLERLEFLLDAAGDCLIRSLGLDVPMED